MQRLFQVLQLSQLLFDALARPLALPLTFALALALCLLPPFLRPRLLPLRLALTRRLELLVKVERLDQTLEVAGDVGYTCETAGYFFHSHVLARWEKFCAAAEARKGEGAAPVAPLSPPSAMLTMCK